MHILFDHGTPSGIAVALVGHEVTEAIDRGWDRISNGDLLQLAEEASFDLLLTTDKNLRYQQNLTGRKIAIVALGNSTWRFVRLHLDRIIRAVNAAQAGSFAEVEIPFPPKKPFIQSQPSSRSSTLRIDSEYVLVWSLTASIQISNTSSVDLQ